MIDEEAPLPDEDRASWCLKEMVKRRGDYQTSSDINLFIGTFNCGAATVSLDSAESLGEWIFSTPDKKNTFDLILIALQEVVDLNNPLLTAPGLSNLVPVQQAAFWGSILRSAIESKQPGEEMLKKWVLLETVSLCGLALYLFAPEKDIDVVQDIRVTSVATGVFGIGSNKGAVGCSFRYRDCYICILNMHLSSGNTPDALERRRENYHSILKRARFCSGSGSYSRSGSSSPGLSPPSSLSSSSSSSLNRGFDPLCSLLSSPKASPRNPNPNTNPNSNSNRNEDFTVEEKNEREYYSQLATQPWHRSHVLAVRPELTCEDFPTLVLCGDLNMQLDFDAFIDTSDAAAAVESTLMLLQQGSLPLLLKRDQLAAEQRLGKSFVGFREEPITFPPTYRLQRHRCSALPKGQGSDEQGEEEKPPSGYDRLRVPAWTDRILYRFLGGQVEGECGEEACVHSYTSAPYPLCESDHLPVSCILRAKVPGVDSAREHAVLTQILTVLDEWELSRRPKIELSSSKSNVAIWGRKGRGLCRRRTDSSIVELVNAGPVSCDFWILYPLPPTEVKWNTVVEGVTTEKKTSMPNTLWLSADVLVGDQVLGKQEQEQVQEQVHCLQAGSIPVNGVRSLRLRARIDGKTAHFLYQLAPSYLEVVFHLSCVVVVAVEGGSHSYLGVEATYLCPCVRVPPSLTDAKTEENQDNKLPKKKQLTKRGANDGAGEEEEEEEETSETGSLVSIGSDASSGFSRASSGSSRAGDDHERYCSFSLEHLFQFR